MVFYINFALYYVPRWTILIITTAVICLFEEPEFHELSDDLCQMSIDDFEKKTCDTFESNNLHDLLQQVGVRYTVVDQAGDG